MKGRRELGKQKKTFGLCKHVGDNISVCSEKEICTSSNDAKKKKCTSSKMELNPIFLFRMLGRSTYARKTKIMTILFLLLLKILCYCTKPLRPLSPQYDNIMPLLIDAFFVFFFLLLSFFFFGVTFSFWQYYFILLNFFSYILMNLPKLTSINMGLNFRNWLAKYSYWFWPVVIMIF